MTQAYGLIPAGGVTGTTLNSGKTRYDVNVQLDQAIDVGGNMETLVTFATFKSDVAGTANSLKGQRVLIDYDIKQKDAYWNKYLNSVQGAGATGAVATTDAAGIPIAAAKPSAGKPPVSGGRGMTPEESDKITRMNVLTTAHAFVSTFYHGLGPDFLPAARKEALSLAQQLFRIAKGETASVPATAVTAPVVPAPAEATPILPTVSTPAEVAAAVPGVQVGAPEPVQSDADAAWN